MVFSLFIVSFKVVMYQTWSETQDRLSHDVAQNCKKLNYFVLMKKWSESQLSRFWLINDMRKASFVLVSHHPL